MSSNSYHIQKNTYITMYDHMFYGRSEFCSYLEDYKGSLFIKQSTLSMGDVESYGDGKVRGMCQYVGNPTQYVYHSHPLTSRSYPSVEDVMKMLKRPKRYSLGVVATRWGIYVIRQTSKSTSQKIEENDIEKYKKTISNSLSIIGFMENDKGYKQGVYSSELKEDELNKINDVLHSIESKTNLDIKFYKWSDNYESIYV